MGLNQLIIIKQFNRVSVGVTVTVPCLVLYTLDAMASSQGQASSNLSFPGKLAQYQGVTKADQKSCSY